MIESSDPGLHWRAAGGSGAITMADKPVKPQIGRRGHHWRASKRRLPRYSADYKTPFGAAAKALQINSDKRLRTMLGDRVSTHTIRDWRRGKAKAPQWALDILREECQRLKNMAIVAEAWLWAAQ